MQNVTENEIAAMLTIVKIPEADYNANNLSKVIGITSMGALKILKKLEKEGLLLAKKIGNAVIYKPNFENEYTVKYIEFALRREAEQSQPFVKRWVSDVAKIKSASVIIIFGSILTKKEGAKDVDVLFITDQMHFKELAKEIAEFNTISAKKLHPIYQSPEDLKSNVRKRDKVVLNAIKGIVVKGEKEFLEALK